MDLKRIIERRRKSPNQYHKISRDRIKRIQKKKVQTTMIGALAAFEEAFGYVWGQGQKDKTDEQKRMSAIWEKTREKILDNGNSQIRALHKELDMYEVSWNRYKVALRPTELE